MRSKILLFAMVGLISASLMTGCGKPKEVAKNEVLKNVKVVEIKKSYIALEDDFAGQVASLQQVGVVPKVPGKVASVVVDIGDQVNKGDLLFTLDPTDAINQVRVAEAAVEAAKNGLKRAEGSGYSQSLIQAQSAFDQAKISYEDVKTNYENIKVLYAEGGASKNDLDSMEKKYNSAKNQFETAERNLKLFQEQAGPDSIEGAKAQLKQAQASLEMSRAQLDNMRVYAPVSGTVASKNINVGEAVSSASPAIVLVNNNNLAIEFNISEKLINMLKVGQKLTFKVDTVNDKTFNAEITNISPAASDKTYQYIVKAAILNSDKRLMTGMFAKTRLVVEKKENVIVVPNQGIVPDKGIQYAYIAKDGIVVKKPVEIGLSNEKFSEVTKGLEAGDTLILESQNFISDGEKVNIIK